MCLLRLRRRSQNPVARQYKPNRQATADISPMQNTEQKAAQDVDRFKRIVEQKNCQEVERLKRIAEQAYLTIKREDLRRQAERVQQEAEKERERYAERLRERSKKLKENVRGYAESLRECSKKPKEHAVENFETSGCR